MYPCPTSSLPRSQFRALKNYHVYNFDSEVRVVSLDVLDLFSLLLHRIFFVTRVKIEQKCFPTHYLKGPLP